MCSEDPYHHCTHMGLLISVITCMLIIIVCLPRPGGLNTLRPRQNGRCFADDTFKRIFLNENAKIWLKISLKFVPKVRIDNIPALVQMMAWRRPGDNPSSEPMMVSLLMHICVTLPHWVNGCLRTCMPFIGQAGNVIGGGINSLIPIGVQTESDSALKHLQLKNCPGYVEKTAAPCIDDIDDLQTNIYQR